MKAEPVTDRITVTKALAEFQTRPLKDAARRLLDALGYRSDRSLAGPDSSPRSFIELFPASGFDQEKALVAEWKTADLLFQLTDQELSRESSLFTDTTVKAGLLKSYVFIAIELKGGDYARGKFSTIARQINRIFPMPVMVFFRHQGQLTIAVINRRMNKLDESKDVLGKVTLIREIDLAQPHRGHLDILASLALSNLVHPQKKPITDFDTLHAAWEQIFNIELLNERFYRELANWYFWALPQVDFPADLEPDSEKRRATGLIRLLTRLIFCWFLKEKGLIPEKLFHQTDLQGLLRDLDDDGSSYYQAILQNLFFATLNQRMGRDPKGQPYRFFAKDEGWIKNKATYDVNNLYRYESLFRAPDTALTLFEDIPFLNGGLFECLDRTEDGTGKKRYLDGFSRNAKKRPTVPNRLFFGGEQESDLSGAYGDTKHKKEKVSGLIRILNRYKFTIVENTPIDQEIALDPELLGKVFENLLASYNEETKTTARKQTGSFYTPRPIVDYMVDESLKAHLTRALSPDGTDATNGTDGTHPSHQSYLSHTSQKLDLLFAYTEQPHQFTPAEVACLIAAIDALKILDPACGSGAFPMGVLHKLVYILGKLDPDNDRWKATQLAKLDSAPMREELERAFADNNDDYGRKLYLIENCLYGVDIQPIAIQITKLRFFISLVCDQKTNRNKKDNHGIRPLPNLETKFVAADTLIGLPEMTQTLLVDPRVGLIEKEIETLYHSHFSIQRRDQKLALQRKIKSLRQDLAKLLAESLMSPAKSKHVAEWDPFDPQSRADFFDPHWMFGASLAKGFDVVIGNPPYGASFTEIAKALVAQTYKHQDYQLDSYLLFVEKCFGLTAPAGAVALIIPNTWLLNLLSKKLRKWIFTEKTVNDIVHFTTSVFSAVVDTEVVVFTNAAPPGDHAINVTVFSDDGPTAPFSLPQERWQRRNGEAVNILERPEFSHLTEKLRSFPVLDHVSVITQGAKPFQVGKGKPKQTRAIVDGKPFVATDKKDKTFRPLLRGSLIQRYRILWNGDYWISFGDWLAEPRHSASYDAPEKIVIRQTGDSLLATLDEEQFVVRDNLYTIVPRDGKADLRFILGLLNSRLLNWFYQKAINPEEGEALAQVKRGHLAQLPIASSAQTTSKKLTELVGSILRAKKNDPAADTSALEREIDQHVYALYALTPEEVAIVEGTAK